MQLGVLCNALKWVCATATLVIFSAWMIYIWAPAEMVTDPKFGTVTIYKWFIDWDLIKKLSITYAFILGSSYIVYLIENPPRRKSYYEQSAKKDD